MCLLLVCPTPVLPNHAIAEGVGESEAQALVVPHYKGGHISCSDQLGESNICLFNKNGVQCCAFFIVKHQVCRLIGWLEKHGFATLHVL